MASLRSMHQQYKPKEEAAMSLPTGINIGTRYRRRSRDPVKLTALIYLREALLEARYESCAEIIAIAKEFGASDAEIRLLLEDPRRHPSS